MILSFWSFWGAGPFSGANRWFWGGYSFQKHPANVHGSPKRLPNSLTQKRLKVSKSDEISFKISYTLPGAPEHPQIQQFSGMKVISKQQMVGCSKHFEVHPQALNIESENRPGPNRKLVFSTINFQVLC